MPLALKKPAKPGTKPAAKPAKPGRNGSSAEPKSITEAVAKINKDYGEGSCFKLGGAYRANIPVLSTGNIMIDRALGVGGFPKGRIVEVFGPESSGKTTLCLSVVAKAQSKGGRCAFIDVEHAVDPGYARKIGVNLEDLYFSQPDSGEQALNILKDLLETGEFEIIVIDSVAALVTRQEIEGEIGDAAVGAQARLMSAVLRKLNPIISKSGTCVAFTNQLREKVGIMFGNPEVTPGGKALKFYASVRIDIRKKAQIKKGDDVIGNQVKIFVAKNKVAPPFTTVEFDLMYGEGLAGPYNILDAALKYGVLEKRGTSLAYHGEVIARGRDAAAQYLRDNPEFCEELDAECRERLNQNPQAEPAAFDLSVDGDELPPDLP